MRNVEESESLRDALLHALSGEQLGFHMPGHLGGRGWSSRELAVLGRLDTTELPHTDNLAEPSGMLKDALLRAAGVFGAGRTHYLLNGSTGGILAMVRAAVGRGETLLVGRDSHRSVLSAIQLSGVEAVFVPVGAEGEESMLPCGPSPQQWLEAMADHPDARALLVTRPNYYGTAINLRPLCQAAHDRGMTVLVDEAHGAHFVASSAFPETALSCGADLVVQSLHKTLPAPTQTALLHESAGWSGVRQGLPVASVSEAVALFQTTSPSWLLMTLMDDAIGWLGKEGASAYGSLLSRLEVFRRALPADGDCRCLSGDSVPPGFSVDPTRLVLWKPQAGAAMAQALWRRHGLAVEMADPDRVVLIVTPFHTDTDLSRLLEALGDVERQASLGRADSSPDFPPAAQSARQIPRPAVRRGLSVQEAVCLPRAAVPLREAAGWMAAVPVVPYPPGVAAIVPGEWFDEGVVAWLVRLADSGISLQGVTDGCVTVVGRT